MRGLLKRDVFKQINRSIRQFGSLGQNSPRQADLRGQVHLVVGALGPVYNGLVTQLINSGSTVVAASLSLEGLKMLQESLGNPVGLVCLNQSPSTEAGAADLVETLKRDLGRLDGVVAHGGLVHSHSGHPWETDADSPTKLIQGKSILDSDPNEVMSYVQSLLVSHVGAARGMMPYLESQSGDVNPSYSIVTGGLVDGRKNLMLLGAEGPALTSMYGFGLALRGATQESRVRVNEVRIGMELNRSEEERMTDPRSRPLSLDIGSVASYVAESSIKGQRLRASNDVELDGILHRFGAFQNLPRRR